MSTNRTESLAIASRYATAMFELALEAKKAETLVAEIVALADAVTTTPALAEALENPLLSRSAKAELLSKLAAKGDALTQQSVAMLATQGRAALLPALAELLAAKLAKHQDVLLAEVTSARPLNKDVERQIETALKSATGKAVRLTLKENPEVLGGVSIRLGSYLLDATLAGALTNMRAQLLAPQYS